MTKTDFTMLSAYFGQIKENLLTEIMPVVALVLCFIFHFA